MYQRIYPSNEVPPNYKGNAFDKLSSGGECEITREEKSEVKKGITDILTRQNGKSFAIDDIILGALIILLLNSHADDELLLILVLLFISGM